MSALVRAELLRLVSRRLLIVVLVGVAGLAALVAALSADDVRPLGAQDYRSAQLLLESERQFWEQECANGPETPEEMCPDWEAPTDIQDFLRTPQGFGLYTEGVVTTALPVALLAAAILAASLVGGEFSSGNIATQLLFTPARLALMASKLLAAMLGGLLVVVTYLGTTLGLSAIMFLYLRGAADMTADVGLAAMSGRAVVLALLIAVMAAALAMGTGSTLITSAVFAVVLLGSWMLFDVTPATSILQFFLPSNILFAMMVGIQEIYDYESWNPDGTPVLAAVIRYEWALAYSVIGTALLVVVSAWSFRRRDIVG